MIEFEYSGPDGRLSKVTNARDDETVITYDDNADGVETGRVAKVTNPDSAGNPHAGKNQDDATETREWTITPYLADGLDGTVRLAGTAGYIGNRESENTSNLDEARATYVDARGNTWVYQVGGYGLLAALANPSLQTGGGEDVWRYERDENGLAVKRIEPAGGGGAKETPLDELETTYAYDTHGNLTSLVTAQTGQGGGNISQSWVYDSQFSVVTSATDARGFVTTYDLDDYGNVEQINQPEGVVTKFKHTSPTGAAGQLLGGLVREVTDPRGNVTVTEYFTSGVEVGLVKKVEHAKTAGSQIQEAASTETFEYDAYRNMDVHIQEMDDGPNRQTDYTYDKLDRLVKVELPSADHIDADGGNETARPTTEYEYDAQGLRTKATDPLGRETSYEYDGMFRLVVTTLPEETHFGGSSPSSGKIKQFYDAGGNLVRTDDQLDRSVEYEYDERNLQTKITLPNPGTGDHGESVTNFFYDTLGNLKQSDSINGAATRTTTYEYDSIHRKTKETYPTPGAHPLDGSSHAAPEMEYEYDDAGNLIKSIDPLDRETTYEYDDINRVEKINRPLTATTTFEYDTASNRTVVKDAENGDEDGRFVYDALNRVITSTSVATGQHGASVMNYEYNDASERTKVSETTPSGTRDTTFVFDALGRNTEIHGPLTEHTDPRTLLTYFDTSITKIQYDQVGNTRKTTDPAGQSTGFIYDDLNRRTATIQANPTQGGINLALSPEALALAGYSVTTVDYDIANQSRQRTQYLESLADNRIHAYEYDQQGRRVKSLEPVVAGGQSQTEYHFDAVGNMTSKVETITGSKTITTEYKYDNLDRQVQTIEPKPLPSGATSATNDLRITSFVFDIAGRNTDVIDTLGRKFSFGFNDLDQAIKTYFPLLAGEASRAFTETAYNLVNAVEGVTDRLGRVTTFVKDAWYNTIQTVLPETEHFDADANGGLGGMVTESATMDSVYSVLNLVTQTTDAIGNVTQYIHDNADRMVQTILPAVGGSSPTWTYGYDINGNHVSTTDPEGNVTSTRYDNQHRASANIAPPADDGAAMADTTVDDAASGGSTFAFAGPDSWNETTGSGGLNDDYHSLAAGMGQGTGLNTATWTFDNLETNKQYEVFVTWHEIAGAASDAKFTVNDGAASEGTFAVDQTIAPTQDFDDATTNWQSLGIFRIVDGTLSVVLSDDADGTVVADGVRVVERPPTSNTVYNAVGEVTSTTDALGRTTTREYDAQGRVVKEIYPDPDGAGAQQSPEMLYEYDLYDRLVKQTYVLADGDDLVTEYEYDDLHRKILERDGNGDETHFAYDLIGNLLSKTDAAGNVTAYEYDAWDRVTKETITVDSVELTREYAYDHEDNLIEMTDRNGRTFQYDYDASDRVVAERWYDGAAIAANLTNTIVTVYDKHNRVHSQRDEFSAYTYSYDDLDRVVSVANFIDNNGDGDSADAGDFTTPGVADVVLDYDYDADNRLIETAATIDGVNDFVNNYAYNGRDYLTSVEQMSQTGGNGVAYKRVELQFDAENQLDQILRYASSGTSQLVASSSFAYDDAARLTAITHAQGANTLAEFRWQYDTANRVSAFSSLVDGTAFYTYDDRDQLTGEFYVDQYFDAAGAFTAITSGGYASSFQKNLAYQYDQNGNRLRRAEVALPDIFDPDHVNFAPTTQFTPIGTADDAETYTESGVTVTATDDFNTDAGTHNRIETDGTHDYLFDAQGNRQRRTHIANDTVTVYTWDVRNRLVKVTDYASTANADAGTSPTQVVEYTYDMHNRRIGKTVDTDGGSAVDLRERYVWDVAAMDGKGNVVLDFVDDDLDGQADGDELDKRYLWGQTVDQLFAQENIDDLLNPIPEDVLWALSDNLGTVRDLVKYDTATDTTSIEEHFTYQGFGEITGGDSTVTRYTYTAQEYDAHTGLFYYDNRWYDAATGQFISPDPIKHDPTNDYRPFGNNPTNNTDPTGLEPQRRTEITSREAFGVPLTYPANSYVPIGAGYDFKGSSDFREHIALGLEIGYRAALIDLDLNALRGQQNRLRDSYPWFWGFDEWERKMDEFSNLKRELEGARDELRSFFRESQLEYLFRSGFDIDITKRRRIFNYSSGQPTEVRDSGWQAAVSMGHQMARKPAYAGGHALEHADFWILFMPTSLVMGGGLRGALASAAKQVGTDSGQALSRVAVREAFDTAFVSLSLRNIRGTVLPKVKESLKAFWDDEVGEFGTALYEVGAYNQVRAGSLKFVREANHTPQGALAETLIGNYGKDAARRGNEITIRLSRSEHLAVSAAQANRLELFGKLPASARELLSQDISILRSCTNAPNSALQKIIELNSKRHPWDFIK